MDQAWTEGYEACAAGYEVSINPYVKGSELFNAWNEGYDAKTEESN